MNSQLSTEYRNGWYLKAEEWEREFCGHARETFKLSLGIHPNKKVDPTWFDLQLSMVDGRRIDVELKPVFTPFLKAWELYSVDPQYAFSFNVSDYRDYRRLHLTNELIFLWVNFPFTPNTWGSPVLAMNKVWYAHISYFLDKIDQISPPIHTYKRRVGRSDNATNSYIFDVRTFKELVRP